MNITENFANNISFIKMFPYTRSSSKSRIQFNDLNEFRKSLFDVCVCSYFG
jgi:hypothetical protein